MATDERYAEVCFPQAVTSSRSPVCSSGSRRFVERESVNEERTRKSVKTLTIAEVMSSIPVQKHEFLQALNFVDG